MAFINLTPGSTLRARQQTYEGLLGNQQAAYQQAADQASRRVLGDVASATQGTGNVLSAGRTATDASRDTQANLAAQGAQAQQNVRERALQLAQQDIQRQQEQERQMVGGLLGGAGQVAGTVVGMMGGGPVGAQIGGNAGGALGGLLSGNPQQTSNPIPGLGGLLGGMGSPQMQQQQQQQVAPQMAPVAPQGTPVTGGPPEQIPIPGGLGSSMRPAAGAMQRMGPDGQMHWYDMQGNIVG